MTGNGHAGFGRGTLEKDRKAPRSRPTSALIDRDWGPAFIKVCGYAPYAVKVCLNAHEWAKRQAQRRGIPCEALDNGFLACADPAALQAICDSLSADNIQDFFDRWVGALPLPLTADDAASGFAYRLSILQMEVSLTQVFDDPVRGREFFEEVIRDNLDLGRPDRYFSSWSIARSLRTRQAASQHASSPTASCPACTSSTSAVTSSNTVRIGPPVGAGMTPSSIGDRQCRDALLLDLSARRQRPEGSRDAGLIRSLSASRA